MFPSDIEREKKSFFNSSKALHTPNVDINSLP